MVNLVQASKLSKPGGLPRKRRQVRSQSGQEQLFVLVAQRCEPSFEASSRWQQGLHLPDALTSRRG
jgi:hypothetical protein